MKGSQRLSLAAVLLSALFLGRGFANEFGQAGPPLEQLYPGPLGMADFGKIVSGEFTGDLKRDAVVMDGSRPKLLVAPETFDSAILVWQSANDIAVLSGALSDPDKDCLLTVSSAGLVRHERNSASATWDHQTIRGPGTSWNGARKLAVGQVDGSGALDIVGVAADGRTVLIEHGNGDGSYTPGPLFVAAGPSVTDLWLLNWREAAQSPGTDEIALNTPLGIGVHNRNGLLIDGMSWSQSPIRGTVIDDAGTPVQRLALVAEFEGLDRLLVFGDTLTEPSVSLETTGVVSLASGDADSDGDSELFVSVDTERKFWMLENLAPASPSFDPAQMTKFPFGPSARNPTHNRAGLVADDFDSDGELDVLAPAQGDPGPAVAVYGSVALVNVESQVVGGWKASINKVTYITSSNQIEFRFTRPLAILQAAGCETRIGVKVYRTPELGAGTMGAPYFSTFIALPPDHGYTPLYLPMPAGFSLETSTDMFSFVARQTVVHTSSGSALDIAPAMTAIFTPEPGVDTIFKLPKTIVVVPAMIDPSSSPSFGGINIGPTVPSMHEDVEPDDSDP